MSKVEMLGNFTVRAVAVVAIFVCFSSIMEKADSADLVKVFKDEKETALYQKLITVKASTPIWQEASGSTKAEYVGAFNIFYHAKSEDGKVESLGKYRIATQAGRPLGWVKKEDVQVWGTRFAIDPIIPFGDNSFSIDLPDGGMVIYDPANIPETAAAYSFILGSSDGGGETAEDDGPFPVCFCIAEQGTQGTAAEANQIGSMQLEVVFVIETTDFLLTEYDGKALVEYVRDLAGTYVDTIKQSSSRGIVPTRLGLVTYQDTNELAEQKRPQILQALTNDLDLWNSKVQSLKPSAIGGDLPEDGLSGIAIAISEEAGWTANSSKHVVLIGYGAFQTSGRMEGGKPFAHYMSWLGDRGHPVYKEIGWDKMFGFNSSGKSIPDIHYSAFPQGGATGSKLRQTKHIHAIRIGEDTETRLVRQLGRDSYAEAIKNIREIEKHARGLSEDKIIGLWIDNDNLRDVFNLIWNIEQFSHYDKISLAQYETLARAGDSPGYFTACQPNPSDVRRVVGALENKISDAIKVISQVATGNVEEVAAQGARSGGDEFTKPIFRIVNSSLKNSEVIATPVQRGTATVRSEKSGRLVGHKVIMVSEEEINRLMGIFNALYEQFDKKRSRAERQDVTSILTDLKSSLAEVASGQVLDSETSLSDLITDLPLRTSALMMTPGDIAVMSTKDFEAWLDELKTAEQRTRILLSEDAGRWITISSLKQAADKYAFLKLSELP